MEAASGAAVLYQDLSATISAGSQYASAKKIVTSRPRERKGIFFVVINLSVGVTCVVGLGENNIIKYHWT